MLRFAAVAGVGTAGARRRQGQEEAGVFAYHPPDRNVPMPIRGQNAPPDPFALLFLMGQGNDGQDPDEHPNGGNDEPHAKRRGKPEGERRPAPEPSIVATPAVGVLFLIVGILGWIALGVSYIVLERRQANFSPAPAPANEPKQLTAEPVPEHRKTETPAKRMEALTERATRIQTGLSGEKREKLDEAVKNAKGAIAVGDAAKIELRWTAWRTRCSTWNASNNLENEPRP